MFVFKTQHDRPRFLVHSESHYLLLPASTLEGKNKSWCARRTESTLEMHVAHDAYPATGSGGVDEECGPS